MSQSMNLNSLNQYEIKICGQLDESWLIGLGNANAPIDLVIDDHEVTTLSNIIMDQAGLVGLIRRLHGIGIVLLSVRQVESEPC